MSLKPGYYTDPDMSQAERFLRAKCDRWCYDFGGDNTSTSTSNSAPWGPAQPYLQDLMGQAKSLYNQGSQYAPFPTVAPFSPQTIQGLDATQQRALNGSPVVNAANDSITNLLQARTAPGQDVLSQWANPGNINPYLDKQYAAASRPVIDSVNAQFSQGGRTGSTANQNALTDRLGDLAASIYAPGYENAANRSVGAANALNQNYNTQSSQRVAAAALAPGLAGQDYTDLQNLLNVGQKYDTQAGNYINDALQRWNYSQDQPWTLLSRYAGNVAGLGSQGQSTTSSQTQPTQSVVPSLLGAGVNLLGSPTSSGSSLFSNLLGY